MAALVWTKHAQEVMRRRRIPKDEVIEAVRNPVQTEPHDGKIRFVGDNGIAVVVAKTPKAFVIVTVLLRRSAQWGDKDAWRLFA